MKKHNRLLKSVIAFTFMFLLVLSGLILPEANKAYASSGGQNRMNVVFVIDDSGSMRIQAKSDPDKLRYEAMELFLALSAESGNYIGAIRFSDQILQSVNLRELNGKSAKEALYSDVSSGKVEGGTAIGTALKAATDMLISGRNAALDSYIILLTDGNTDLATTEAEDESNRAKQDAISLAQSNGIKVMTICLNAGGQANKAEVKDISDATGGKSVEVQTAADLNKVFTEFYGMIYSTTPEGSTGVIGADGKLEVPFDIPNIGVEEVNIVINATRNRVTYTLTDPSGYTYSQSEIDQYTIKATTFSVIKITRPAPGDWLLTISGVSGDQVSITLVTNNDIEVAINSNTAGNAKLNTPIGIDVSVTNCGNPITDPDVFKKSPIYLVVENLDTGNTDEFPIPNGGTSYDIEFDTMGDYTVSAYVVVDNVRQISGTLTFSVVNTAPTAKDFTVDETVFPFSKEKTFSLSKYASDPDGDPLTFDIYESELEDDTVEIHGDELTIDIAKCGSGTVTLTATDAFGATVSFECQVSTTNALIIIVIIILVILAIVGLVVFIIIHKSNTALINGTIKLSAFGDGQTSAVETVDGMRGKMYLGRNFNFRINTGLNVGQCYFHAGDRDDRIVFVSKTGYFTDYDPSKRNKKIVLDDQVPVTIYSSEEMRSGIKVTFKADGGMY